MTSKKIPKVSIITPTYNRGHLIEGAIKSVLRQGFEDYEYLIVDDGSEDNTRHKVTKHLKDPRLFYVYKDNGGQASALNLGIRLARSPWIAFLDSDDEYKEDHLEYLLSEANSEKDLDFVIGNFEVIGANPSKSWVVDYYRPSRVISLDKVEVVQGTLLVKKECLQEIGGIRGILTDIDLVERLKNAGFKWKRAMKPTLKYYFARTADSVSLQYLRKKRKAHFKKSA